MNKVLVVEDSEQVANAIRIILESEGIKVDYLDEGAEVVDYIVLNHINLVILDLMMPGIDGYDVFNSIKSYDETNTVPVIILTAKTDALRWDKEIRACDKFMKKPFDNKELVEEVKRLLKESKQ